MAIGIIVVVMVIGGIYWIAQNIPNSNGSSSPTKTQGNYTTYSNTTILPSPNTVSIGIPHNQFVLSGYQYLLANFSYTNTEGIVNNENIGTYLTGQIADGLDYSTNNLTICVWNNAMWSEFNFYWNQHSYSNAYNLGWTYNSSSGVSFGTDNVSYFQNGIWTLPSAWAFPYLNAPYTPGTSSETYHLLIVDYGLNNVVFTITQNVIVHEEIEHVS